MEPKKKKSNCAVDAYATGDIGHSFALVESYRQKDDDSGPFPDKGVCVCSVFFSDRGPGLYEQTWGGLQRIVRGLWLPMSFGPSSITGYCATGR